MQQNPFRVARYAVGLRRFQSLMSCRSDSILRYLDAEELSWHVFVAWIAVALMEAYPCSTFSQANLLGGSAKQVSAWVPHTPVLRDVMGGSGHAYIRVLGRIGAR